MHIHVYVWLCVFMGVSLEERPEFHNYNFVASRYIRIGFTRRNVYKVCQGQRRELVLKEQRAFTYLNAIICEKKLSIKSCHWGALTAESTLPWLSYKQERDNWSPWDEIAFPRSLAVEEQRFSDECNCDNMVTFERSKSWRKMCCCSSRLGYGEGVYVPSGKKENMRLQT